MTGATITRKMAGAWFTTTLTVPAMNVVAR